MIDVNKLLTAMLAGGPGPDRAPDGTRSPPATTDAASFDIARDLPKMLGGVGGGGLGDLISRHAGTLGTGTLAGGIAGILLGSKHARKYAGTALQVGAAAVLGGLAYKAYQDYRAGRPVVPPNVGDALGQMLNKGAEVIGGVTGAATRGSSTETADAQTAATLMLRAMIAAAMADGRIDDTERKRLIDQVEESKLSAEERQFLEALIAAPDTPASLAAAVTSPELAAQVYFAAVVAIDADTEVERAWLDALAAALKLDPTLRAHLEAAGAERAAA